MCVCVCCECGVCVCGVFVWCVCVCVVCAYIYIYTYIIRSGSFQSSPLSNLNRFSQVSPLSKAIPTSCTITNTIPV